MTYAELNRRVTRIETRVADLEETLLRDVRGVKIFANRLAAQSSTIGEGVALMMQRMGLTPIRVPTVEPPTQAEIDESFEDDC
ncbi:hypothetical protein ACFYT3_18870 [Nocardia amikacinitolerans]|uniref:Uncharacterized protein n=1 Tax=Nocardia amikacinitolerans TaxID=756689 RepID=A0A285LT94_9NOCA|nr:hypothetical protein [Nocardia amikacinitolerans]MCP2289162.1 hypothetical protein [Nocardia amikacinitolerans]SNY88105.1 hypothetical protein SAMN04244553_5067 [Nocardia amikacinitolerans]